MKAIRSGRESLMVRPMCVVLCSALVVSATACSKSEPATPTQSTVTSDPAAPVKSAVLTAVSPINRQSVAASLTTGPTLTASMTSTSSVTLQYRFQVMNSSGAMIQDSGLINGLTWTIPVALTPNASFTWTARAEYQGIAGPWSDAASFITSDPPPAYNRPIGPWQQCASERGYGLVRCVHAAVNPTDSVSDLEVVKRVAWILRNEAGGLAIKNGGDNTVLWQGYSFSSSRICFTNSGQLYKIITDAGIGGANGPAYNDNGIGDPAQCVAAIDPSKP